MLVLLDKGKYNSNGANRFHEYRYSSFPRHRFECYSMRRLFICVAKVNNYWSLLLTIEHFEQKCDTSETHRLQIFSTYHWPRYFDRRYKQRAKNYGGIKESDEPQESVSESKNQYIYLESWYYNRVHASRDRKTLQF